MGLCTEMTRLALLRLLQVLPVQPVLPVQLVLVGPRDCSNPEGPDWDTDRARLVLRAVCLSLESARPTPKAS